MTDVEKTTMRKRLSIQRGDGHPTWGAVWIDIGRLRLIRCARHPSGRRTLDHPNAWMICWRRKLPEWDRESYERVIRPMSTEEKNRYFAAKFPQIDGANGKPRFDVAAAIAKGDAHEVAAQLPALTKITHDLAYRLPGSGKPLAYIVLTHEQADELLRQAAIEAFALMQPTIEKTVSDLREELQKLHTRGFGSTGTGNP
jgi:hypothetical protein